MEHNCAIIDDKKAFRYRAFSDSKCSWRDKSFDDGYQLCD